MEQETMNTAASDGQKEPGVFNSTEKATMADLSGAWNSMRQHLDILESDYENAAWHFDSLHSIIMSKAAARANPDVVRDAPPKPCSGSKAACTDFNEAWRYTKSLGEFNAPGMLAELTKHQDVVHDVENRVDVK